MTFFSSGKQSNIVIVGCDNYGSCLAEIICNQEEKVSIIDIDGKSFDTFTQAPISSYVKGDATDIDVLELAGIRSADILIAATNSDNINIMIAQIAKKTYHVNRVIIILEDLTKEFLCSENEIISVSPLILAMNQLQHLFMKEKK
ncbi:MAG: NAD-binding protein [Oscillospiraceae bacterium]